MAELVFEDICKLELLNAVQIVTETVDGVPGQDNGGRAVMDPTGSTLAAGMGHLCA